MGEDEGYLPLKEAAVYLDISRTTLWNMAREGRIKVYSKPTDKRAKLFKIEDLDALKRPQPLREGDQHGPNRGDSKAGGPAARNK